VVRALTQCSAISAFAYIPDNAIIQPIHYSASFYPVDANFFVYPPTVTTNPREDMALTFTWSATAEWIDYCLTTGNPTNPGLFDLFFDTFDPANPNNPSPGNFTLGGQIIDASRCVPLLIGANHSVNK
jgi:hypothetical protein